MSSEGRQAFLHHKPTACCLSFWDSVSLYSWTEKRVRWHSRNERSFTPSGRTCPPHPPPSLKRPHVPLSASPHFAFYSQVPSLFSLIQVASTEDQELWRIEGRTIRCPLTARSVPFGGMQGHVVLEDGSETAVYLSAWANFIVAFLGVAPRAAIVCGHQYGLPFHVSDKPSQWRDWTRIAGLRCHPRPSWTRPFCPETCCLSRSVHASPSTNVHRPPGKPLPHRQGQRKCILLLSSSVRILPGSLCHSVNDLSGVINRVWSSSHVLRMLVLDSMKIAIRVSRKLAANHRVICDELTNWNTQSLPLT